MCTLTATLLFILFIKKVAVKVPLKNDAEISTKTRFLSSNSIVLHKFCTRILIIIHGFIDSFQMKIEETYVKSPDKLYQ